MAVGVAVRVGITVVLNPVVGIYVEVGVGVIGGGISGLSSSAIACSTLSDTGRLTLNNRLQKCDHLITTELIVRSQGDHHGQGL